ncbi:hypothetical protein ACHAPX_007083 [Trichoderma viride]
MAGEPCPSGRAAVRSPGVYGYSRDGLATGTLFSERERDETVQCNRAAESTHKRQDDWLNPQRSAVVRHRTTGQRLCGGQAASQQPIWRVAQSRPGQGWGVDESMPIIVFPAARRKAKGKRKGAFMPSTPALCNPTCATRTRPARSRRQWTQSRPKSCKSPEA